ncbi:MAG TPA: glycosyltransferase family 1 protein [Candidatus Sulfotelmatobacter sp.]|jgi:glycosyltransferase involved in cell wall biosynthesis|nr:glycosyltransferase family 1 protein [Candidatus Sulfotelmatobacter sp.]
MPAVKIAIDIRRMTEFGVGTYIRNVVRALDRLDHENTYFLIGSPAKVEEIGVLRANFHTIPLLAPERSVQGYREFRSSLKRLDCDLVHIPNLFSVPRALPCPYVMTVHDMLEHMSRAREQSGLWRSLYFQMTKRVLAGAARIFAVSNFTRNEIEKLFEIPAERIEVVYNAIDERFLHGHANTADRDLIARRYQVTYPFLLYAGRISPHKNVVRMIEAFSALKTELERDQAYPDLKLIIIGDDLSGNPDLRRTVVRSGVQNDVRFLGFIPIEVLRIFYDEAKVFVFPSLYEGFGLPPLEAMVHGTPVVTSNVSSLPEVVGNAAVLVNPENVFEIMRALHRVLMDQSLRNRMKERGYQQAAKFSWEKSVRRILEAYVQVTEGDPAPAKPQSAAD